jgi:alpha-tubulin suppressor-like RCC1 family protein
LHKKIEYLKVTAVGAGMYHSAALTATGQLFTWGSNSKGQLGLGAKYDLVFSPTLVDCLAGVPLAGFACGAFHNLAASVSGAVFAWGANSHGQLGLGDTEDRLVPTQAVMWIQSYLFLIQSYHGSVFRLARIRIPGSLPLTSGSGSCSFRQ